MVFTASFLAELLDEYRWGLAGNEEVCRMAKKLLQMTAEACGIQSVSVEIKSAKDIKDAFCRLAVQAAARKNTGCKSKTIRMDNERKFQAGTMECINSLKDIPAGQATYVGRY